MANVIIKDAQTHQSSHYLIYHFILITVNNNNDDKTNCWEDARESKSCTPTM